MTRANAAVSSGLRPWDPLLLVDLAQTMRGIQVGLRSVGTASRPSGDLKGATPGGEGSSPRLCAARGGGGGT